MILVDSSIWIDQLGGRVTLQTRAFEQLVITKQTIGAGDLMVIEVLQGTRSARAFREASAHLNSFVPVQIANHRIAVQAARNYRALRERGITIRRTIDTLIATRCILDRIPLLYGDRDFDPFVEHLGLMAAIDLVPGVT